MADPNDTVAESTDEGRRDEAFCSTCNHSFGIDLLTCPNDGSRLVRLKATRDDVVGRVLDGRYEIRAPLGRGGMGTVYRGWQLSVDREVAIKVIHPKLADDRATVKRFLREARLASRLNQPSIVNVYDFGQCEDILYLVMELLRGHTLAHELSGRRLNLKRTVVIGSQLCDALEAAHAQDIVHRDLKPGNIVILDDPPGRDLIKVLDFGLAKSLVHESGSHITNPDAILGTPLYMAPEQIDGGASDQRADLYSLGCILYEMVSGAPPFIDGVVSAVLARHLTETPAPIPSHLPARLAALIAQLLAKDPAKRIQAAGEVRAELELVLDGQARVAVPSMSLTDVPDTIPEIPTAFAETLAVPTPIPMAPVSAPVAAPALPSARDSLTQVIPARRGAPLWVILGAIALTGLAAFLVFVVLPDNHRTTTPLHVPAPAASADAASADAAVLDAARAATVTVAPDAAVDAPSDAPPDAPPPPQRPTHEPAPPPRVPKHQPTGPTSPADNPDTPFVAPPKKPQ